MSELNVTGLSVSSICDSNWRKSIPSLTKKFGYILNHEEFCDVSFCISDSETTGEIVKAHKLVLMTASEVFERMFSGNFVENNQDSKSPIDISDIGPSTFKTMLKFIYTEELSEESTTSELIEIINAARKYDICELEEFCWKRITNKITIEDSVAIFEAAQFYENKALEDKGLKFLINNFEKLLTCEDFINLSIDNLRTLLTVKNIFLDTELKIFNAILRWSAAKCREQNITLSPVNQRLVLGDIIYLINFTDIPTEDIASTVFPSEILTYKECTLLFQHLISSKEILEQLPKLPFSKINRQRKTHVVKFNSGVCQPPSTFRGSGWCFKFHVDKAVKIVGLGFSGNSEPEMPYTVSFSLNIIDTSQVSPKVHEVLAQIKNKLVFSCKSILSADLDEPLEIEPFKVYRVNFSIQGPSVPWFHNGSTSTENGVTFFLQPGLYVPPEIKVKYLEEIENVLNHAK